MLVGVVKPVSCDAQVRGFGCVQLARAQPLDRIRDDRGADVVLDDGRRLAAWEADLVEHDPARLELCLHDADLAGRSHLHVLPVRQHNADQDIGRIGELARLPAIEPHAHPRAVDVCDGAVDVFPADEVLCDECFGHHGPSRSKRMDSDRHRLGLPVASQPCLNRKRARDGSNL